jgi:uncharacterized protein
MTQQSTESTLHRLTIAPIIAALENLGAILAKAEKHAASGEIPPDVFLASRLYPNMFNLIQQLQYALFIPMDFAQHFHDLPPPKVGYEEASFADVHKGLAEAIAYLKAIDPKRLDERAQRIVPTFFDSSRGMPADAYAAGMIMPDFYFHLAIAYAILRHNGVPLGKGDFIGKLETSAL